jgi:hypothetical protein
MVAGFALVDVKVTFETFPGISDGCCVGFCVAFPVGFWPASWGFTPAALSNSSSGTLLA